MNTEEIVTELDKEIERLTRVRHCSLRPLRNHALGKRRTLSPEARMRIVEVQRKRWAKAKKQNNRQNT